MSAMSHILKYGQPAIRKRTMTPVYNDLGEVASKDPDSILGFLAIVDRSKDTRHGVQSQGIREDIDQTILCYYDDTDSQTVLDISAVKSGLPDTVHFGGVFDVTNVELFNHAMASQSYLRIQLRRKEHAKSTMSVTSLVFGDGGISNWAFNMIVDVVMVLLDEFGSTLSTALFLVEALVSGTWTSLGAAVVSGTTFQIPALTIVPDTYKIRYRYTGDDDNEGKLIYQNITVDKGDLLLTFTIPAPITIGATTDIDINVLMNDLVNITAVAQFPLTVALEYYDGADWVDIPLNNSSMSSALLSTTFVMPSVTPATYPFRVTFAENTYYLDAVSATSNISVVAP